MTSEKDKDFLISGLYCNLWHSRNTFHNIKFWIFIAIYSYRITKGVCNYSFTTHNKKLGFPGRSTCQVKHKISNPTRSCMVKSFASLKRMAKHESVNITSSIPNLYFYFGYFLGWSTGSTMLIVVKLFLKKYKYVQLCNALYYTW